MAKKYYAQLLDLCVYIENWDLLREYEEILVAHVVMKVSFYNRAKNFSFIDIEQY